MLSYELLKFLHIISAFILVGMATYTLLAQTTKATGAGFGIGGLATLIFGLGLIGALRSGLGTWMIAKLVIWLAIMMMVGIVNKRFPQYKPRAAIALYGLAALAVYMAVYKP